MERSSTFNNRTGGLELTIWTSGVRCKKWTHVTCTQRSAFTPIRFLLAYRLYKDRE